jgi:poly-gamma-glutamate capsule biosynthesis protein CapA/YwtB (metallophosphatase superfamily)
MAVTVMSVGDVFADNDDGRDAFRTLEPLFEKGDIVFGNCEGVYSDRPAKSPSHKHFMGTSTDRGGFFGEVGFDVMSCANNHMVDGGYVGMEDTQNLLRGQGIEVTGAGANLEEALRPAVLEREGAKVAFLGVCSVYPKGYEARPSRGGIAALRVSTAYLNPDENFWEPGIAPDVITRPFPGDVETIRGAIAAAKEQADYVVIAPHWGYSSRLVLLHDYELELAREMVEAGADAVVCHHHHALRAIEFHQGRPIFYGLGALVHHFQDSAVSPEMRADRDRKFGEFSAMRMPKEEFRLFPFAEDARKTMVASFDVADGGEVAVGYFPAHMMADGSTEPFAPDDPRGPEALEYMESITRHHGFTTRFALTERDGFAFVEVTESA